jgi:Lysophospholipase L1 and related esterases
VINGVELLKVPNLFILGKVEFFMRTYRSLIRLIQVASALAFIVLITGFLGVWGQGGKAPTDKTVTGETAESSTPALTNTKIVALGDSFTLGYPLDAEHSWTQRLADDLKVTVVNKGKSRQTSKDLLSRFDADVVAEKPGRVIIFAGIGDGIQGIALKEIQTNIQAIVEKAKANHIVPVLALPIAYPGAQQNIKETRDWESSYAKKENILTLDFSSVLFDESGKFISDLSSDGKYPNAKGYTTMGDYAASVLK